ncbi:hypothetical protein THAR02_01447 [Trichoderma harzianum]|uniref:NACHT domain-containing protein n=1 Tax=Trichoderma harzianum TaxID=5544 RepID=A0A0G0APN2_TRIHA|nr:hypothetical protein THAR02_01447 [Trichoderma harzianum]
MTLQRPSKVARLDGDQYGNEGAGSQHNNTGAGKQYIAQNIYIDQDRNSPNTERFDCLQDLSVTDPREEKARIEDTKGGLLVESYKWILEHEEFNRWQRDECSGVFWIRGSPGKGKTMLLCGIIDSLCQPATKAHLPSFFLCQHDDPRLNDATEVLRGLIYLLAIQRPSILQTIQERFCAGGRNLLKHHDPFLGLSKILRGILTFPTAAPVYLIVDALDECRTDLEKLLDFIRTTSTGPSTSVKWIITSRHHFEVQQAVELVQNKSILDLDTTEAAIFAAVNKFVDHKVSQLARIKKYPLELIKAVRNYLRDNAQGTFLWVALVCQALGKIKPWNTRSELYSFPAGLKSLYEKMMDRVMASDEGDLDICMKILAVAMVAQRPIRLAELPSLADLGEEIAGNSEWLGEAIGLCGSFLVVRQGTMYFVHQSAKLYLEAHASDRILTPSRSSVEYSVYSRSLRTLRGTLKRDMYGMDHPGVSIRQIKTMDPGPLEAAWYSCVHWVDHLGAIDSNSQEYRTALCDFGDTHLFIRDFFIYWLEALSLLRSMTRGVLALGNLELLVEGFQGQKELLNLVKDARQFILRHRQLIEVAPLQTYASALVFSPTNSLVRTSFTSDEPKWIEISPVVEDSWTACVQILQGHRDCVTSVVYSSDNKYLASASVDHSIRVWDALTGEHVQTLEGHNDTVNSIAFLHGNYQYIASAAGDGAIKIWKIATGQCIQTLQGHSSSVRSVAFSHDNNYLASSSTDRTIKIWDSNSWECLYTLKGHSNWVNAIQFLRGDKRLVSASSDSTLKVWDIATGRCEITLEGHSDWVNSLCCSNDDRFLVSASSDHTLKIWDHKGECVNTFTEHTNWVNSVVISNDGNQFASASNDQTIKIWDIATGTCMRTMKCQFDNVNSVAFSCDDTLLASAWTDRSIKIWKTNSDDDGKETGNHTNFVNIVIFTSDGKYLGSTADDQTVKVWDVASGKCIYTISGHSDSINSIVFSHNDMYLASGSSDTTIKIFEIATQQLRTLQGNGDGVNSAVFSHSDQYIASVGFKSINVWGVASGQPIATLEGHFDYITSGAFSREDKYLASSSNDRTCRIWDLKTASCIHILEGHSDYVSSVSFSRDSKYVVSTSGDKTVKIWDMNMGTSLKTFEGHSDWISSATFSNDGRFLASTSTDSTIRIWNTATGECAQCIRVKAPLTRIEFGPDDSYILTERGCAIVRTNSIPETADVGDGDTEEKVWQGYGLSSDRSWITYNGENILWLPLEYRVTCFTISSSLVSVGSSTGKLLILGCSNDILPVIKFRGKHIAELSHDGMDDSSDDPMPGDNDTADNAIFKEGVKDGRSETDDTPTDLNGHTQLHLAVLSRDEQAVKRIVEEGRVTLDRKDRDGHTALFYAFQRGERNISLLLAQKWNMPDDVVLQHLDNQSYEYNARALFSAIKRRNKDEVGFLIEIGADMEARGYGDWPGWKGTALHEAAWYGTLDILKLMLRNGANRYARDVGGRTPSQRPNWARTGGISRFLS